MIPGGQRIEPPKPLPRWHNCRECDVRWFGDDAACWSCGETTTRVPASSPAFTSTGLTRTFTEDQWDRVRNRVLSEPDPGATA